MRWAAGWLSGLGLPAFFALAVVAPLYMLPARVRALSRDDPVKVKARMVSVGVSSVVAGAVLYLCGGEDDGWTFSRWVGIDGSFSPRATAVSLLLVATLYAGPLYAYFRARRLPSGVDSTLLAVRNYLVAPVAEEWIFRGCILPPLLCAGFSPAAAALTAPLFFGAAHLHHAIEMAHTHPLQVVVVQTAFQFSYTTLFGAFAGFVLLRTGSLLAAVAAHTLCNYLGVPTTPWLNPRHRLYGERQVIIAALAAGVLGFGLLLAPLTDPADFEFSLWRAM